MTTIVAWGLSNAVVASALALVAFSVQRWWRRPAFVHALWLLVLLKLVTPPLVTLPTLDWPRSWTQGAASVSEGPVAAETLPLGTSSAVNSPSAESDSDWDIVPRGGQTTEALPVVRPGRVAAPHVGQAAMWVTRLPWGLVLLCLWVGGLCGWLGLAFQEWCALRRLVRKSAPVSSELQREVAQISGLLGVRRPPEIAIVAAPITPGVMWLGWRSVILLPQGLCGRLSREERQAVLAHELSHVRRLDPLVRWLEVVVIGAFWWLPTAWWARRNLRAAEETCCDAWVLSLWPGCGPTYARAVLSTLDFIAEPRRDMCLLTAGLGCRRELERRLIMICKQSLPARNSALGKLVLLAVALLVLPLGRGLVPPRAQAAPPAVPQAAVPPADANAIELPGVRVVDAAGKPVAGVEIRYQTFADLEQMPADATSGADGTVILMPAQLRGGGEPNDGFDVVNLNLAGRINLTTELKLVGKQELQLRLPIFLDRPALPETTAAPSELAGTVVDEKGKPIEGVKVDAWTWFPGNESQTDANGQFKLAGFGDGRPVSTGVEVRFSKAGYCPVYLVRQPSGVKNFTVVLSKGTGFTGKLTEPDGSPAKGARIRALLGTRQMDGGSGAPFFESQADDTGMYEFLLPADVYALEFRTKAGVLRLPKAALSAGQMIVQDYKLEAASVLKARVVDAVTGKPLAGLKLSNFFDKAVADVSDASGNLEIGGLIPGDVDFNQVELAGYTRWWSEAAKTQWERKLIEADQFQRNFDGLTFKVTKDMPPVTITVEPGVTISGRVVDPHGKPVPGATVAPAKTGSGNSLTGDTRFTGFANEKGEFTLLLPASGAVKYNLMAYGGDRYGEQRAHAKGAPAPNPQKWASGVSDVLQTKPGETISGLTLTLTVPATVTGRVVDSTGKPVPNHRVRASAADLKENRYFDPEAATDAEGRFELKFIRPGQQYIQADPFWLNPVDGKTSGSVELLLKLGETKVDVELKLPAGTKTNS